MEREIPVNLTKPTVTEWGNFGVIKLTPMPMETYNGKDILEETNNDRSYDAIQTRQGNFLVVGTSESGRWT